MTTTLTAAAASATWLATASDSLSGGCGGVCGSVSVSVGGVAAAFRRLGVFVVVVVAGYFVWLRFSEGATDEEST